MHHTPSSSLVPSYRSRRTPGSNRSLHTPRSPRRGANLQKASSKRKKGSLASIYFDVNREEDEDYTGRGRSSRSHRRSGSRSRSPRRRTRSSPRRGRSPSYAGSVGSPDSNYSSKSVRSTRSRRSEMDQSAPRRGQRSQRGPRTRSRGRAKNLWDPSFNDNMSAEAARNMEFDDMPPRQSISAQNENNVAGGWTLNVGDDSHLNKKTLDRHAFMMAPGYGREEHFSQHESTSRLRQRSLSNASSDGGGGGSESLRSFNLNDGGTHAYPRGGSSSSSSSGGGGGGTKEGVRGGKGGANDSYGQSKWVTIYGFNVRKHEQAVLDYLSKADWSHMADFLNRVLQHRHKPVSADIANRIDMIPFLASSTQSFQRNITNRSFNWQDVLKNVFQLENEDIDVIQGQQGRGAGGGEEEDIFDQYKYWYLRISNFERLMILDHHVGQGNSMDVQFATTEQANVVLELNGEEINIPLHGSAGPRTKMLMGVQRTKDVAQQQRRIVPPRARRLNHIPGNNGGVRLRTDAHSGLPDGAKRRKRGSTRAPEYMVVDHVSIMKHPKRQMSCCEMARNFFTSGW